MFAVPDVAEEQVERHTLAILVLDILRHTRIHSTPARRPSTPDTQRKKGFWV